MNIHLHMRVFHNRVESDDTVQYFCTLECGEYIEWSGDCLIFYFATTKTDQKGEKQRLPWHVYSNPLKPHILPCLGFF